MRVYGLPPTVLPLSEVPENVTFDFLAHGLASLGYPGFAHLRGATRKVNPAEFLLSALSQRNLEARVAEGLPWLVLRYFRHGFRVAGSAGANENPSKPPGLFGDSGRTGKPEGCTSGTRANAGGQQTGERGLLLQRTERGRAPLASRA